MVECQKRRVQSNVRYPPKMLTPQHSGRNSLNSLNNRKHEETNIDRIEKLVRLLIMLPAAVEAVWCMRNQLRNWNASQSTMQSTQKSTSRRRKLNSLARCNSSMADSTFQKWSRQVVPNFDWYFPTTYSFVSLLGLYYRKDWPREENKCFRARALACIEKSWWSKNW